MMAYEPFDAHSAELVRQPSQSLRAPRKPSQGWNERIPPGSRFAPLPDMDLEMGERLNKGVLAYETYGRLSANGDNAVLIFTGMSGNAHVASSPEDNTLGWWEEIVGPGRPIDTSTWFVICLNSLGGCNGSTGPASINADTGKIYGPDFLSVSIEDIADSGAHLLHHLGIRKLACLVGVSMGGMTSAAFLQRYPTLANAHLNISGATEASAFAISVRSLQREIVQSDPAWCGGHYRRSSMPNQSMTMARKLGVLTYRSAQELQNRFGRAHVKKDCSYKLVDKTPEFEVTNYVAHQASGFAVNFDANSFLELSGAMDRYSLTKNGKISIEQAFANLELETAMVLGSSTDILFPPDQQQSLARAFEKVGVRTKYQNIETEKGHDAFLAKGSPFARPISDFFNLLATNYGSQMKGFS